MLKKEDFIRFILEGQKLSTQVIASSTKATPQTDDLMSLGFDIPAEPQVKTDGDVSFAQSLLVASDFGKPDYVQTTSLIRSSDSVARHLPPRASFWSKTPSRPYQTLLFETDKTHKDLLAIPAFKSRKMSHLDIVEDALARMVSEALEGFQKGGEGVTADVRKGRKEETLCIISIKDEREQQPVRLVCFGTVNAKTDGLETFHLTEQTRFWDQQLAKDHLGLLYERQFRKLGTANWQEAFTTSEEREQAEKLLKVCSKRAPSVTEIQENVLILLDTIAKGFGLRKKAGHPLRLQAFVLPSDHDIGIDAEELTSKHGDKNPFGGVTLRDEKNRLLGYIVYPLKKKEDAVKLRSYLEKNNRFHNVLVVFPDGDETTLELWQGTDQLSGKLRKDHGFHGAAEVVSLLSRFFVVSKAKVRNPTELAQELAYRARYLRRLAIKELENEKTEGPLRDLYNAFKQSLVHDQTEKDFADAFAQTLTYGLLTSRWLGNDKLIETGERFTRQNALKYLPTTSNFLGDLFKTALSVKLDEQRGRLLWLVDDIADLLDRIDVSYVFGIGDQDSDQITDPVIHFYEPFLAAYDNELRNKRGVYFTPRPVVSYIVRSVHELLQTEFGLEDGLASNATWGDVQKRFPNLNLPDGVKASDAFVCILDPATGTGTFLFECIEVIERSMKGKWCKELKREKWDDPAILARWQEYVPTHLLPRLYGYELMMASYSIAHLKLAFKLGETGYHLKDEDRLHVYLTNSLEPPSDIQQRLNGVIASLAKEAQEVSEVKRGKRYSIVIGNPPYSVKTYNSNPFIDSLMSDYKKHVRGEQGLVALSDDYLKFIRFSQEILRTTESGIWGMITNHGYLRGVIHRGVRCELLNQFEYMHVVDLHGDTNVGERPPAGKANVNVFDIQQGVAVTIGLRIRSKSDKSRVFHLDSWGTRLEKYNDLATISPSKDDWAELHPCDPLYYLVPFDDTNQDEYSEFPLLTDIMPINSCGVKTHRDAFLIDFSKKDIIARFKDVAAERDLKILRERYGIKDTPHWRLKDAKIKIIADDVKKYVTGITYRPFDNRWIYYNPAIIEKGDSKFPTLRHMLQSNIALIASRIQAEGSCDAVFSSRLLVEMKTAESTRSCTVFPLFLTSLDDSFNAQIELNIQENRLNFSDSFLRTLSARLGLKAEKKKGLPLGVNAEDIFNYIYSVLYSPSYRFRYSEFLRSGFPRIPLTNNISLFRSLASIGRELVSLHLLESEKLDQANNMFAGPENPEVVRVGWSDGGVWLDAPVTRTGQIARTGTIGFKGVSEDVWNFHIGGYQVCEKWLNYRKGLKLSTDDIAHFQKVIVAISETIRLMAEIDKVIEAHGGWPGAFQSCNGGNQ